MQPDANDSLNDGVTTGGRPQRVGAADDISFGDERTTGGGLSGQDTLIDGIEIVDLEARYRIEGELGQGGMGAVLLATDTRLDRKVAIKRILGEAAGNRMAVQRFLIEAKAIAALNHPNIVQIYDYGRDAAGPFLIMEYVDGGSLLDRCRQGPMPIAEAIAIACHICDGLANAHDARIIHRDIKPANILLTKDGIPKLTDFGLAKAQTGNHGHTVTGTGAVMGTPDFMPPEQRQDAALVDHRSDLWSLAATVYQMVTGRSPKIIRLDLLPGEITGVLGRALEDEKEARYQSARELRDDLRAAVFGGRALEPAAGPPSTTAQEGRCSGCGTINGDRERKFCRTCGDPLRTTCLQCTVQIPVWDTICGECGTNQQQLLAHLRADLEKSKATAEKRLAAGRFDEAMRLAHEIASTGHPRLDDLASWARSFAEAAVAERDRQTALVATRIREAKAHADDLDYASALRCLETLPEVGRTSEVERLQREYASRQREARRECAIVTQGIATRIQRNTARIAEQLQARIADLQSKQSAADVIDEIKERVRAKEIDGLVPLVRRALALGGDREPLQRLLDQLLQRRDASLAEARAAFETGAARSAAARTIRLRPEDLEPADLAFVERARRAARLEEHIVALIEDARRNGGMSQQDVWKTLGLATEHRAIVPHGEQVVALLQRCKKALPPALRTSFGIALQRIPSGVFTMGDSDAPFHVPLRQTSISRPFWIGIYPVTNAQWAQLMGKSPSRWKDDDLPVEGVTWEDAREFCRLLSSHADERTAGRVYRLPTAAEWEYACRAGTTTGFSFGDDATRLNDHGWHYGNSAGRTHPVGHKSPNGCGLHDMHGNVWEWCGNEHGPVQQYRGGCYDCPPEHCRSAAIGVGDPALRINKVGFRIAMDGPEALPPETRR